MLKNDHFHALLSKTLCIYFIFVKKLSLLSLFISLFENKLYLITQINKRNSIDKLFNFLEKFH